MEARRKDSLKWTDLPNDFLGEVQAVIRADLEPIDPRFLTYVEGRIYPHEVLISIGYALRNELIQHHFDLSWDFNSKESVASEGEIIKKIHAGFDYLRKVLIEHAESDGVLELPTQWKTVSNPASLFFQYSRRNNELEAEANRLLGLDAEGLAKGDWSETDETQDIEFPEDSTTGPTNRSTLH